MEVQNIVNINYQQTGASSATNNLGMREMQAKAYEARNQRFCLLKHHQLQERAVRLCLLHLINWPIKE